MWTFKQTAVIFLLLFSTVSLGARSENITFLTPEPPVETAEPCGDFLDRWGQKPERLTFVDCQKVADPRGDRLIASYTVKGQDAVAIEAILQQKFRMAPLKFLCCGWEPAIATKTGTLRPAPGEFVDDEGRLFEVTMTSEETKLNRRQDWAKVSQFNVKIIQHFEMPRSHRNNRTVLS